MLDDDDVGDKTTSSYLNSMSGGGFFSLPPAPNAFHGYETSSSSSAAYPAAVYDSAGMLSEMFDFGGSRQSVSAAPAELLGLVDQQNPHISGDSAAMHHFFTNPSLKSSPALISDQTFHAPQFTWIPEGNSSAAGGEIQGLSLSLASEKAAAGYGGTSNSTSHEMMFFNTAAEPRAQFGFGTASPSVFSLAAVNVLRNSKYTRPAQELLEEFCSVGRGVHHKKTIPPAASSSVTKEPPAITHAQRMEHQRRKVKLTTMLDEVERRYSQYCEQLQMVVNSYEMVMGFGAAVPYTALAQKAMSRHFRCLKDGVQAQLRHSCEVLGEKDLVGGTGITKGETPRLKILEHNLRKQRAFHQMGIMEQEAWRPQRGLPERSVNILRAWLFEHFLHPYPSDADKHLLARQTGLSRNQVANWFINARVRLWKPMIEDIYQQESKDQEEQPQQHQKQPEEDEEEDEEERELIRKTQTPTHLPSSSSAPTPKTTSKTTTLAIDDNDPSLISSESGHHQYHHIPANYMLRTHHHTTTSYSHVDPCSSNTHFGTTTTPAGNSSGVRPTMIRFGTTPLPTGDVSLTLGLRHGATGAGGGRNPSDKTGFSFTDFNGSSS